MIRRQEQRKILDRIKEERVAGMKVGAEEAKKVTADLDYGKEAREAFQRIKAGREKGLEAKQFDKPRKRLRSSSRALGAMTRMAGGDQQGIKQTKQDMETVLNDSVKDQMMVREGQEIQRQSFLQTSLPLAYASLAGNDVMSLAKMQMANKPTPIPKGGLLTQIFS